MIESTSLKWFAIGFLVLSGTDTAQAQFSLTGTSYSQNFDGIGSAATASLPAGWLMTAAADTTVNWADVTNVSATTQQASAGTPNTGGRYNWGNGTTTTDRAIGFMTSGSYASPNSILFGFTNANSDTITDLTFAFDYERYRINSAAAAITFFTSIDGSTWTALTSGDSGAFSTGTNAYNFSTGTTVNKSGVTLSGLTIAGGSSYYLRWAFNTTGSNSQGLGLDNFVLSATLAPPPSVGNFWVGSDAILGGPGTWTAAGGTSWRTTNTDGAGTTFDATQLANFGGTTADTVTVSGTVAPTKGITFATTDYNVTGGTIDLAGTSAADNTITTPTAVSATIASDLTGSNGLTKAGPGSLTLSGTNSYTGGTTVGSGTLTGTTNSLQGPITNNAAVAFDQATDGTYAGNMTGTGSLTKLGAGNVTLSGTNGYGGGTTVTAGTLTGTTASLQGPITNNAAVAFDQGTDGTYAGNMTGTGSLTKLGAGNVTLSGTNGYGGGTTVTAGTLTGTTTSLQGAITNNAAIVIDQATPGTYAGNMTGVGSLTKLGAGNVTLSGTNDYGGGTTVTAGTLTGTTTSLQGDITNNAAVIFNQTTTGSYSGNMIGTGTLTKSGTGEVTLSGGNSFQGGTVLNDGILVAGSATAFGTGAVTVKGGSLVANAGLTITNDLIIDPVSSSAFTATYNFTAGDTVALITGSGFTASNLSRGNYNGIPDGNSGLPSTTSPSAGSGTFNAPINAVGGTLNTATSAYFEFTLDATTASSITLADMSFLSRSTSSGPLNYTLRSSLDGYTADLASGTFLANSAYASKSNTGISTTGDPVTFRLFGSGGSATASVASNSANWRLDDLVLAGTTLSQGVATIGSTSNSGTATFAGGVTLTGPAQLIAAAGGTSAFTGIITGPGSITKTGLGIVNLSAANTYTGSTTISGGTLQLGAGGTTGSLSTSSAITNNGTFTINRSNAVSQGTDFSGSAITGTGGLSQAGSGTTTLNAANTYSGGTTLSAGRLNLNNASAIGTGAFTITGGSIDATVPGITLSTNNVLNLNADFTFAGTNNLNLGTGDINLNANRIITVTANTLTLGGNITSELYTITKQGDGTLNLTGTNAYTGPTTISSGVVSISNVAALGTGTAAVSIAGGSSLEYSGATATLTKDITVTSGTGTIRNTGVNTLSLSGVLTKDGTVLKFTGGTFNVLGRITGSSANSDLVVDNATVTLNNSNNDYNGPTFIQNSGKVIMAGDYLGAVPGSPTAGNVVLDNGTLNTTADVSLSANRGIAVGPSTGSGTGTLEAAGSTTLTVNGIIANNGSGTGALTKTGGGTVALTAANTYTGATTISGGTLSVGTIGNGGVAGNLGQAGNAATNLVFDGGTLQYTGSTATSDRAFTINAGKTATINTANGLTLAGATGAATDGALTKTGAGNLTLTGAGTNTGSTTISAGTLQLGAGSTTGSLSTSSTITNNGTFAINRSNAVSQGTDFSGSAISGSGGLSQAGAGMTTLNAANTYTGGTTVSAGTLNITNTSGSATGTGNVLIQDTATLQGSGSIVTAGTREITVNSGGTVAIGDLNATTAQGAKILTLTPESGTITTTFETGSTLRFDLFTNAGNNYATTTAADLFRTGGNLTFRTGVNLKVNQSGTFTFANGNQWRLLDWTTLLGNAPTGNTSQLILDLPTLDTDLFWDVSTLYTTGSIGIVPEPSRTLFLALGLLTLALRRRR